MDPETLQNVLQEAGIQVDMKSIQNPTEEFMIYLISEYLKKFNFDSNEISMSTFEQLEHFSCPDSASDAIKAINLYTALKSVCDEIFLKDICLTDITSPGPKRVRKQMKILFNFFAYVRNKLVEKEIDFVELDNLQQDMESKIELRNEIVAKTRATIVDRENKLKYKQQLQQEIDKIRKGNEEKVKKSVELQKQLEDITIQHQDAKNKCNDLKAKAIRLRKETTDLQAKIVKSPEEYEARSKELEKILEIKKEERQIILNSITGKKSQIKNNECAQKLVKDLNEQFSTNSSTMFNQLKETSEQLELGQKELNELKADIAELSKKCSNSSKNVSKAEDRKGHEKLLHDLNAQYKKKERELQSQNNILEQIKTDLTKQKSMLEDKLTSISVVQNDNANILQQYSKHLQNELSEEITLREDITDSISKNANKYGEDNDNNELSKSSTESKSKHNRR